MSNENNENKENSENNENNEIILDEYLKEATDQYLTSFSKLSTFEDKVKYAVLFQSLSSVSLYITLIEAGESPNDSMLFLRQMLEEQIKEAQKAVLEDTNNITDKPN